MKLNTLLKFILPNSLSGEYFYIFNCNCFADVRIEDGLVKNIFGVYSANGEKKNVTEQELDEIHEEINRGKIIDV